MANLNKSCKVHGDGGTKLRARHRALSCNLDGSSPLDMFVTRPLCDQSKYLYHNFGRKSYYDSKSDSNETSMCENLVVCAVNHRRECMCTSSAQLAHGNPLLGVAKIVKRDRIMKLVQPARRISPLGGRSIRSLGEAAAEGGEKLRRNRSAADRTTQGGELGAAGSRYGGVERVDVRHCEIFEKMESLCRKSESGMLEVSVFWAPSRDTL